MITARSGNTPSAASRIVREGIVLETSESSFFARNEFLIRRLHSLSGLIPVGAYLCVHLLTNASIWGGGEIYQANVDKIHALGPLLPFVEWAFIFIPLLFHAVIGFIIIGGGLPNTTQYPYARNVRYTLQRITGIVAFVFIVWHVLQMHYLGAPLKRLDPTLFAQFDPQDAAATASAALQGSLFIQLIYAIGILSSVYHLANGIWTMGITWGVWTSAAAQRRADFVCSGFGAALAVVGVAALLGFIRFTHPPVISLDGQTAGKGDVVINVAGSAGPVTVVPADATLTDRDSETLAGLIVKIVAPLAGDVEVLSADTTGTAITASFDGETLKLSGTDTLANYQQVFHTITYHNLAATPHTADRRIGIRVTDGQHGSNLAVVTVTRGSVDKIAHQSFPGTAHEN